MLMTDSSGQDDRRLEVAQLIHLRAAGQFAETVAYEDRGRRLLLEEVAGVRNDGGDAGADGVSIDERDVAHGDARHIGYGIERSGTEDAGRHAEITRAFLACRRRVKGQDGDARQKAVA